MTRVGFSADDLKLIVEGHAESGPAGEDLVCAGCSVLWLTVEEALCGTKDRAERMRPLFFRDKGVRRVICCPEQDAADECRTILQTAAIGYEALAVSFPKYVSYMEL